jgi:hypothetical protein
VSGAFWLKGRQLPEIPRHPSEYKDRPWADKASLESVLAGLSGPFRYPIVGDRTSLFLQQYVGYEGSSLSWLRCNFYERLRTPQELINSLMLYSAYRQRGLNYLEYGVTPPPGSPSMPLIIALAVEIFPSIYDAHDGIVPMPGESEDSIGMHLVHPIGVENGLVVFRNNWGQAWGRNGLGYFSIDYLKHYQREAWVTRFLAGPSPDGVNDGYLTDGESSGPSEKRLYRQLLIHSWIPQRSSPFFPLSKDGSLNRVGRVDIAARWLIGTGEGSVWLQTVAILPNVDGGPIIVGWMHMRATHNGGIVEELFIWPPYRELGIGTTLAGRTLLHSYQSPALQKIDWTWHASEADAMTHQRPQSMPRIPGWLNTVLTGDIPAPSRQSEQEDVRSHIRSWMELIAMTQARWC